MGYTRTTPFSSVQDLDVAGTLSVDIISEKTSAAGVTIDGVKLKDSEPYCDVINEKTGTAGVTIDGVKLKDSEPYCDVINEKTATAGVTIDGYLIKDSDLSIDKCLIQGGNQGNLVNSGTRYAGLSGQAGLITSDQSITQQPMAHAGILKNFYVKVDGPPGGGKTWTFTIQKNGADQSLEVVISGASEVEDSDISNTVAFAVGDLVNIKIVPSGSPTSQEVSWCCEYQLT